MDASRFDQLSRLLSRRGLPASLAAMVALVRTPEAGIDAKPKDICGGEPTSLSRYCAGVRTCTSDSDCAPRCSCIERPAGCCYTTRRNRKLKKRRCVDLNLAFYCTPR
jgi:hypothetical protein